VEYALNKTLSDLKLDYVDLYLIHFPLSLKFVPIEDRYPPDWLYDPKAKEPRVEVVKIPVNQTWRMMEDMVMKGKAQAIGLSNFNVQLIREVLAFAKFPPSVLQVELHPYLSQETLIRFCKCEGIQVFAYSPLGHGAYVDIKLATDEQNVCKEKAVMDLAKKYNRSPQQIVLRWGLQRGTGVIFKSNQVKHIEDNLKVVSFELNQEDMKAISNLNRNLRFNDPAVFGEKLYNTFLALFE
jgi:D-xylose reductase